MKTSVLTAILVTFSAAGLTIGQIVPSDVEKILATNPELKYLGNLEHKRFFHINESTTWYSSDQICKEVGMNLVAIETEAEYKFLNTAEYWHRWPKFWTGARDDRSRAQYRWTTSGQPIGSFAEWNSESATESSCIFMTIPNGGLREYGCNYGMSTVCQLV